MPRIAIAWHALPPYGARLIRHSADLCPFPLAVIGTPSHYEKSEIETILDQKVTWVDRQRGTSWRSLGLEAPEIFFSTGWAFKAFTALAADTKMSGGINVCMVDNQRKYSLRQALGKYYFRSKISAQYDHFLVPGESASSLLRYFGVPLSRIHKGMYGADPNVFRPGPPLNERQNDFLFVGQFIPRKGLDCLLGAVRLLRRQKPAATLIAVGSGPMEQDLRRAGIRVEPFSSSERVAKLLRDSRFLVLPSIEEHWGLVVHEAVLSGCGLILSQNVGSLPEFAAPKNSWTFRSDDREGLAAALSSTLHLDAKALQSCMQTSLHYSRSFGPARWHESLQAIVARYLDQDRSPIMSGQQTAS